MIDAAERTLDLQVLVLPGDITSKLVVDRMLAAADRGVRIRLLSVRDRQFIANVI